MTKKTLLPKAQIQWIVDRHHVGSTEAEIEADIRQRSTGWPARMVTKAVVYALEVHANNRAIYRRVCAGI